MKKISFQLVCIICSAVLLFSCKKDKVDNVDFNVTADADTYRLGDTVVFRMSGNPDVITFYSGDSANNYDYKDRVTKDSGILRFSFQFRPSNDSGYSAIAKGALRVLFSNKFSNNFSSSPDSATAISQDSNLLNTTNWVDITDRFTLPSSGTVNTYFSTPSVVISDLLQSSADSFNIAFKYAAATSPYLGSNGLTIGTLSLTNSFPDGGVTKYNLDPGGSVSNIWKVVKAVNPNNAWATSKTQLKLTSKATATYSEDWAISNTFYPNLAFPDVAIPIKNIANAAITSFAYKFTKLGLHKVVFVASNNRDYGDAQLIKIMFINIVP